MTTGGEGGMVTTNSQTLWSKMWSYKDHGKSWEAVYERKHPSGFRWLHDSFGTNWRMTEMQAVIGRIQLRRLVEWQKIRQRYLNQIWSTARQTKCLIAPRLACVDSDLNCDVKNCCSHAAYKCYVFVTKGEELRNKLMNEINEKGVPCYQGSCSEVYLEKAFDDTDFRPKERLPVAKKLGETSLMFLCHPTLSQAAIDKTCSVIREVCADKM
jgi:dTDP-4-amino-4,6-dideoxygalactose transaminase